MDHREGPQARPEASKERKDLKHNQAICLSLAIIVAGMSVTMPGCGDPYYSYQLETEGDARILYGKWAMAGRYNNGNGLQRVCAWDRAGAVTYISPGDFKYLDAAELALLCQEHSLKIPAALAAEYQRQTQQPASGLPGWGAATGWSGAVEQPKQ